MKYISAIVSGLLLVGAFFVFTPDNRTWVVERKDCRANPGSECLIEEAVRLAAMNHETLGYLFTLRLALMGRFEHAKALEKERLIARSEPEDFAAAQAKNLVDPLRLAASVRLEESWEQLLNSEAFSRSSLWIGGLEILGELPFGKVSDGLNVAIPRDRADAVVAQISDILVEMAQTQQPMMRNGSLNYAARLRTRVGDRAGAISALQFLQPTERRSFLPDAQLVSLIGFETALERYRATGEEDFYPMVLRVRQEHATPYVKQILLDSFKEASVKKPWPDVARLLRLIEKAVEFGFEKDAERLAFAAQKDAQQSPSPFRMFDLLKAAHGLLLVGDKNGVGRQAIESAIENFPTDERKVLGIGLHSGPIGWDKGLREEAEAYVAKLLMRSGDITAALDWVVSVPKNRRAWVEVGMKTSPEQFLEFLTQAEATLSSKALVDLKAGLLTQISNTSVNHNQAKWAFSEVKQLRVTGAKLRQERKGLWLAAVRLARMHDDQKLAQDILTERAHFELAAKNPDGLSHVALEWLRHERTKKVPRPNQNTRFRKW